MEEQENQGALSFSGRVDVHSSKTYGVISTIFHSSAGLPNKAHMHLCTNTASLQNDDDYFRESGVSSATVRGR